MAHVVLQVVNGPLSGQRIQIRQGQIAKVGRTEWADFCIAADTQMADVHFALEGDARGWKLRDLSGRGVQVNRVAVSEAALNTGDRLRAGATEFSITMLGEPSSGGNAAIGNAAGVNAKSAMGTASPADSSQVLASTIAERVELDPDARALLTPEHLPEGYFELLKSRGLWLDAVRFLAMWLPKREAVRWGCRCHAQFPPVAPLEQQILVATDAWVDKPEDDLRRAAMDLARKNDFKSSSAWLASAAFWSTGSILDREQPAVAADEGLTGRTVAVVLLALAFKAQPTAPGPIWQSFLKLGEPLLVPPKK